MNAGPRVIVVTGVSGSGKTAVGTVVARSLGWPFQEGDLLHGPENIDKMRSGEALSDEDRWPWLLRVAAWIQGQLDNGRTGVVTCSALKRRYRDLLRCGRPEVVMVLFDAPESVILQRMKARTGHFMPASLFASQVEAFEPPDAAESVLRIDVSPPIDVCADEVFRHLSTLR